MAAVCTVVAVLSTVSVSAQTFTTNLFGGTNSPNPDSLSVTSLIATTNQAAGLFGPGYNGTLTLGASALTAVTETMNAGGNGTYAIGEAGVAAVNGTFTATKTFADTLLGGQSYQLTLTKSANSAANLLTSFTVQLSTVSNGNTISILDTTTGTGLLGVTNVLGLFGTSNTATFSFQTPAGLPATPVTATFGGGLSVSAINSTFIFTGASIQAVPEPGTWATLALGSLGLLTLGIRRRCEASSVTTLY